MKTVVGIGQVVLDETIVLKSKFSLGSKIESDEIIQSVGGPVSSAVIFSRYMGANAYFFTSLAKDKEGYFIRDFFDSLGISVLLTFQSKTQKNIVLTHPSGERTIIKDKTSSKTVKIDKSLLALADIIFLDRHQTGVFDQIITYKKPEALIIFDPSTEVSLRNLLVLRQIKYPIVPYEFILKYTGKGFKENLVRLYSFLKKDFIVTLGRYGALVYGRKLSFVPAFDIDPVDELGAGDIFRAGFAFGILEYSDTEKAIEFANKASALQCMKKGNSSAVPRPSEINSNFLRKKDISLSDIFDRLNNYKLKNRSYEES